MFTRRSYQQGSLRKVKRKRGPSVWEFRYGDNGERGRPMRQMTLSTAECPTKAQACQKLQALVWKLNEGAPQRETEQLTFGALCDLFIEDEHLEKIGKLKSGQPNTFGGLKVSTARSYLQIINNHVRPRWGTALLKDVKPAPVQDWLRQLQLSSLTKSHIKGVLSRLFNKAMLWEVLEIGANPMTLIEIRGASKRKRKPQILTVEQCSELRSSLPQPYRTMVLVAQCTGLRISEILALKWGDVDLENLSMKVCRAVTRGVVDTVKTEYSEDELPLDSDFATQLLHWKGQCPPSADNWMFPSSVTGRPFEPGSIQQNHVRPAGAKARFECGVACL